MMIFVIKRISLSIQFLAPDDKHGRMIYPKSQVKYLGVMIDYQMKWDLLPIKQLLTFSCREPPSL